MSDDRAPQLALPAHFARGARDTGFRKVLGFEVAYFWSLARPTEMALPFQGQSLQIVGYVLTFLAGLAAAMFALADLFASPVVSAFASGRDGEAMMLVSPPLLSLFLGGVGIGWAFENLRQLRR